MAALAPEPVNACDLHCIPPGLVWYAILQTLIDISNGETVPVDVNTLLEEARCLECEVPPGLVNYLILAAIQGLSSGGGLTPQQVYSDAAPPAAPDDPTKPAVFYPSGGGVLLQWDGAAWV